MHLVLQTPSLQHLAGVRIVAHLWNQRDFITLIPHSIIPMDVYSCERAARWQIIKSVLENKVRALPLPERCIKPLVGLIKPLGTEIILWCQYYNEDNNNVLLANLLLPPQLCWTMRGTIDYKRTAELIVKDERVDLQRRFELACIHCLEDEARQLFERVAEERGEEWVPIERYVRRMDLSQLILFFTQSIELDVRSEAMGFDNKFLFGNALRSSNRAMCEYVFQTFTNGERNQVLRDCRESVLFHFSHSPSSNVIYYLSLLNKSQQKQMFEDCVCDVLLCLLHWPMQSLFVEVYKCGWQSALNWDCPQVLSAITRKIGEGSTDYDYAQLLWQCWRLSPVAYKQYFLKNINCVEDLLATKGEEFIQLVLNQAFSPLLKQLVQKRYDTICEGLMDESAISEAALMECKQTAALESSNDGDNVEKRLRSEHLTRLFSFLI